MRVRNSLGPDLPAGRWDAAAARQILGAWRRSGLSVVAFAGEHGVGAQRLYWWRKRLESKMDDVATSVAPLTFIPAAVSSAGSTARLVLRLPGGVEIEATGADAVPADWVAALVRALASHP